MRFHKNPEWISQPVVPLGLDAGRPEGRGRGEIPLAAAYALARVPRIRQRQFLELARTMPTKEFRSVGQRLRQASGGASRKGSWTISTRNSSRSPHLRHLQGSARGVSGPSPAACCSRRRNARRPLDAWYLALQWVLHLDEASVNRAAREGLAAATQSHLATRRRGGRAMK